MRLFLPLLWALCVAPILCIFHGTCPRKEPAPGVLVLSPGSGLVLSCGGHVEVDGAKVSMGTNSPSPKRRQISADATTPATTVHIRNKAVVSTTSNSETHRHTGPTGVDIVNTRERTRPAHEKDTGYTASFPANSTHAVLPAGPVEGEAMAEEEEGDHEEEEEDGGIVGEGSRVTRALPSRPQWKWNGRMLENGERDWERMTFAKRGSVLSLSSVRFEDSGKYSCYYEGREVFTLKVIVTEPFENPGLSCYKRSPSSKIRCEGTTQKPLSPRPNCYLLHSRSGKTEFLRLQCAYSSRLSRCWCTLDYDEDELRTPHMAYLCVTSIAGNATSAVRHFTPFSILKPDPPSNVTARQVEGQATRLRLSWSFPASWKSQDRFYELNYELKYKPREFSLYEQVHFIKRYRYHTITDAMPGVEYLIQVRTKEEFDGQWSDWSTPVYASSWTAVSPTVYFDSLPTVEFPVYSEGSGTDDNMLDVTKLVSVPDAVSPQVLWIPGAFVLLSVIVAMYTFRHRHRFLSKLQSLSAVTQRRGDSPHPPPPPSAPSAPEVQALVTFDPPCYRQPPPSGGDDGEEEGDTGEEQQRAKSGAEEAMHFNNTSYFLVPR